MAEPEGGNVRRKVSEDLSFLSASFNWLLYLPGNVSHEISDLWQRGKVLWQEKRRRWSYTFLDLLPPTVQERGESVKVAGITAFVSIMNIFDDLLGLNLMYVLMIC